MNGLPVARVQELAEQTAPQRWLVEGLWAARAVGIVGGEPKSFKSFLALDLAVAVASGSPCLRRYPVSDPGRVLMYAAEDPAPLVRRRLEGICHVAGVDFASLDVQVITAPELRLDRKEDRQRLAATLLELQPRLLVLDPFVRLHAIDENAAGEVAAVLGYLRRLERRFGVAVVLVHHARKGGAGLRAGQALRGSSELHAWGDSNLYLRRHGERLRLSVEHRGAASTDGVVLHLAGAGDAVALEVLDDDTAVHERRDVTVAQRVAQVLAATSEPLSFRQLRRACGVRASRLSDALAELAARGDVSRSDHGYELVAPRFPFPTPIDARRETLPGNTALSSLPGETDSGAAGTQPEKG
jgi:hypothetical protein